MSSVRLHFIQFIACRFFLQLEVVFKLFKEIQNLIHSYPNSITGIEKKNTYMYNILFNFKISPIF